LAIAGDISNPLTISAEDLKSMPRTSVTAMAEGRELDPALTANDIIVADTTDGKPLLENQGPLRIVAPHDKCGARSVRMLQRLEIVRLRK
jgi:DMSO/TMAO reductase YedYZ molybdopterin-dependent catalytic subunit